MVYKEYNKKILFCYFHPSKTQNYTPLDIGYIIAAIKDKYPNFLFEIAQMSFNPNKENSALFIREDINLIKSYGADAAFLFLDNIFWSGSCAFGRAKKIAEVLRQKAPDLFVGFQSYKITEVESKKVCESGLVNCVVRGNPMDFFQNLGNIFAVKKISGDFYGNNKREKSFNIFPPSPYLEGTLDKFLSKKQEEFQGSFRAYVHSSIGCPFKCHYCFRGIKNKKIKFFSASPFYDELEYLFNNFGIRNFMLLDDVFIITKQRLDEFINEFQKRKKRIPGFENISLTAMIRPELVSEKFIPLLKKINIKWLQLGLQTINPDLQHYMNRGISIDKLKSIMQGIMQSGIGLYLDVIMGLPNDTLDYFKKTIDLALGVKPTAIQVIQLRLNPGTYFYLHQDEYGIVAEKKEREFSVPYVSSAAGGMDDDYFEEAIDYVMKKVEEFPSVRWSLASSRKKYASPGFW